MTATTDRVCLDCGSPFRAVEDWKVRCYACWLARKEAEKPAAAVLDLQFIRVLLQLCHPDRNGGSEASHKSTSEVAGDEETPRTEVKMENHYKGDETMNTQALAVNDDDDDIESLQALSERADELIAVLRPWHEARNCMNKDERTLAATEEDLVNICRQYFEW
jgi:hypothetical protein